MGEQEYGGRFDLKGRSLREHSARGTIVNAAFMVGLNSLALVRAFVVAALLTAADYGVWGILVISVGTLVALKQAGVSDRYVQQDEDDQELAFHKAMTVELTFAAIVTVAVVVTLPLFALAYGRDELILPGLVFAAALPASALGLPAWVFYRRMEFVKQRIIQSVEPVTALVVTVCLAALDAGYWSLVIGLTVGAWSAAAAAQIASPYRFRIVRDSVALRDYWAFSWPILIFLIGGMVVAQGSSLIANHTIGLAAVGALSLAAATSQYADKVDAVITDTLYPAICAVKDRTELLFEAFVKSNRLTLMWGFPFGVALSLFAADLIEFGIGDKWSEALPLFIAFGLTAAFNHIGFNWHAFYRARGDTRPLAVVTTVIVIAFFAVPAPLLIVDGLRGLAIGMGAMTLAGLAARAYYLARLFRGFKMARHALRAVAPTVPAALAVLAVRTAESGPRSLAMAIAELVLYAAITAAATAYAERDLLREVVGYLRRRPATARVAV